jgi:hypothetical protein
VKMDNYLSFEVCILDDGITGKKVIILHDLTLYGQNSEINYHNCGKCNRDRLQGYLHDLLDTFPML